MARLRGGVAVVALVLVAATGCELDDTGRSAGPRGNPGGRGGAALRRRGVADRQGAGAQDGLRPRTSSARAWADTDSNGCGTRDDILKRDLDDVKFTRPATARCRRGCSTRTRTPARTCRSSAGRSKVDIDHVVALSDAWQKGAQQWDGSKRIALANDPLNLLAVDAGTNRGKGDGDTATWLPPNKAYRCTYVAAQVAVKKKYGLWVTSAETGRDGARPDRLPRAEAPRRRQPDEGPGRLHAD